jgi:rhodanese-related sulfurtransferase
MIVLFLRNSLFIYLAIFFLPGNLFPAKSNQTELLQEQYQCTPCGQDCDKKIYNSPGMCTGCGMSLVKKSSVNYKTIQPAALCQYIHDHPGVLLLDVRTKEEFEGKSDPDYGTLKNAINIPVQVLAGRLSELASYKKKAIIVYCSHSHRSAEASYILTQNGFLNVTNMAGGMSVLKDNSCKK